MKKNILTFYFLIFVFRIGVAQKYPLLVSEYFIDNKREWVVEKTISSDSYIANKSYYIYNRTNNFPARFFKKLDFKKDLNLVLEVKVRQLFGNANCGYGIMFCAKDYENNYNFEITSDGHYRTSIQHAGGFLDTAWKKTQLIKPKTQYNVLKISIIDSVLSYYINDKFVCAKKIPTPTERNFGFVVNSIQKIQIDYLKLYVERPEINIVENPISNEKINLGENINTEFPELMPFVTADGRMMFFTRRKHPDNLGKEKNHNDIWFAKLENNEWTTPKNIGMPLNNSGNNFIISISGDNNMAILNGIYTAFGECGGNGFSICNRINDSLWSIPKKIVIDNFYNRGTQQNVTTSSDLQYFIMAVQRDDTYGENDLYVSFRRSNGTYSEPKNMGKTINTEYAEGTPFLASDNKTLYFFSCGHNGYGSADIFVSKRLDDSWTNWSKPLNLGPYINTPNWDGYFTLDAKGEFAYFVSCDNSLGEEDIFKIKLQEELKPEPVVLIYGKVYDSKTKKYLDSQILYDDLSTNQEVGIAVSNKNNGEYQIILPYGKKYGFFAKKHGYMALSDFINLTDIKEYTEIKRNLYLTPIEVNQQIVLNNIFFEKGTSTLLASSFLELERLVKIMNENKEISIEVQGHTNNIGDKEKLKILSEKRAATVKNYLVEKGIDEDRISIKGFGADKPIAPNDTEEGRKKNQRVEFLIVDD